MGHAAGTVTSIFVIQVGHRHAQAARICKAGDTIPSYAGPLGNETEIARFGTVPCWWAAATARGSFCPSPARLQQAAGNGVHVMVEARSEYLLYWRTVRERRRA